MPVWRVSLTCEGGGCVGVARQGDSIWIGNTTSPEAPVSKFTFEEWDHFVAGIKLGHFDDLK
jgi:hypothetical protein